jgi:hypothetical protein
VPADLLPAELLLLLLLLLLQLPRLLLPLSVTAPKASHSQLPTADVTAILGDARSNAEPTASPRIGLTPGRVTLLSMVHDHMWCAA